MASREKGFSPTSIVLDCNSELEPDGSFAGGNHCEDDAHDTFPVLIVIDPLTSRNWIKSIENFPETTTPHLLVCCPFRVQTIPLLRETSPSPDALPLVSTALPRSTLFLHTAFAVLFKQKALISQWHAWYRAIHDDNQHDAALCKLGATHSPFHRCNCIPHKRAQL